MRTFLHPRREELLLPNVLYALGDPVRLQMVAQLAAMENAVSCSDIDLVKQVPKSTGSYHFKLLRESGIIRMVPEGRRVLVSLRHDDLEARFPGLLTTILHAYQTSEPAVSTE